MKNVLRYVAFGLSVVFAASGAAFIVGDAFAEPGGARAVLYTAAWAVPTIALASYALWRPASATTVLALLVVASALFVVVDAAFDLIPRDEVGPLPSIAMFSVCVALGFLGLSRPGTAGGLLIFAGAANAAGLIAKVLESGGPGGFGGSTTAVTLPALVIGGLYLAAGHVHGRRFQDRGRAPTHSHGE